MVCTELTIWYKKALQIAAVISHSHRLYDWWI